MSPLVSRFLLAFSTTATVMVALDLLWLGVLARPLYQQGIGHLMAERPIVPVAVLFYAVYAFGLVVFAVAPQTAERRWSVVLGSAALFGFVAYATYDLTNLATLKAWPAWLSALDMAWGTVVSVLSAAAGRSALAWLDR
jgi:uncharacterized membrane protein